MIGKKIILVCCVFTFISLNMSMLWAQDRVKIALWGDSRENYLAGCELVTRHLLYGTTDWDFQIHTGDFTEIAVLEELRALGNVKAVCGNMDSYDIQNELPARAEFVVGQKKIGLTHGSGHPQGLSVRVRELFDDMDIIFYGHSHQPDIRTVQGSLMVNPGPARYSYALVEIGDDITAQIINI